MIMASKIWAQAYERGLTIVADNVCPETDSCGIIGMGGGGAHPLSTDGYDGYADASGATFSWVAPGEYHVTLLTAPKAVLFAKGQVWVNAEAGSIKTSYTVSVERQLIENGNSVVKFFILNSSGETVDIGYRDRFSYLIVCHT
jgi:hypothetical protein